MALLYTKNISSEFTAAARDEHSSTINYQLPITSLARYDNHLNRPDITHD
ncbi:hypothetical protein H6G06_24515 [Anabaena sphaerica FACHB-251]|uniref:Uncharacterized protein n=1 Tax=Anabaena sphaerica FACHB-251 TaxID=2692883 RepID=A0A927A3U7_9NOST|nr:hypothetical protein [Anabaena sphaerica]MBD2296556.1 hypothetical protein [Anabaena sphaerica FACHB-251]